MRESDLPSPMIGGKGHHLRRITAQSISSLQVNAAAYGGKHPAAVTLAAFLTASLGAVNALMPVAPTGVVFTPTAKTYSIAAGKAAGPTLSKGGSGGKVTYFSATPAVAAVDPATGKVTPLTVGTSVITASIEASGGYLAATKTYLATVTA